MPGIRLITLEIERTIRPSEVTVEGSKVPETDSMNAAPGWRYDAARRRLSVTFEYGYGPTCSPGTLRMLPRKRLIFADFCNFVPMKTGFPYNSIIRGTRSSFLRRTLLVRRRKKGKILLDSVTAEERNIRSAGNMRDRSRCRAGLRTCRQNTYINNIGPLREVFNDSNKYHYAVAERIGIAPDHRYFEAYHTRRPVVRIEKLPVVPKSTR